MYDFLYGSLTSCFHTVFEPDNIIYHDCSEKSRNSKSDDEWITISLLLCFKVLRGAAKCTEKFFKEAEEVKDDAVL